jgi:predicted transcriptional regulator
MTKSRHSSRKANLMSDGCSDILISLEPHHSDNVLSGRKTVEVRRRRIHVQPGTRIWIYTKRPRARVDGFVIVESVHSGSGEELWTRFSSELALSRPHYDSYMSGCRTGCAIVIRSAVALDKAIPLEDVRGSFAGFHPPQFFKKLLPGSRELAMFRRLGCP